MNAPLVRNACPTLRRPMQTGDGLLARLNPVAAGIAPAAMIGLAEAALRHGNGVMEVTQRGSLQIRGLSEESALCLEEEVEALGIAVRAGVPVETGPLAGLDPLEIADARPLADAIRAAIAKARLETRLGPKVSVVVDGGGRFGLESVLADLRLQAVRADGDILWRLAIGGTGASALPVGSFAATEACAAALKVLHAIAGLGRKARARDLADHTLQSLRSPPSGLPPTLQLPISPLEGEMAGRPEGGDVAQASYQNPFALMKLSDSRLVLPVGLPFGSVHASDLIRFLESAAAAEIRLASERRLLLLLPAEIRAEAVRDLAVRSGFVTDAADNRVHIAACPGAPACGSGEMAARDIARAFAADHAGWMPKLHISGCAKRCAAPRHKGLALIGRSGFVSLVVEDDAVEMSGRTATDRIQAALARVVRLLAAERRPGESETSLLRRVGPHALASAFEPEP